MLKSIISAVTGKTTVSPEQAELDNFKSELATLEKNGNNPAFGWTSVMLSRQASLKRSIAILEAKLRK